VDAQPIRNCTLIDPAIVAAVCGLPRSFRAGAGSLSRLVEETGYGAVRDKITVDDIRQELIDDPSLIDEWQNWSFDKRTSEGWYLQLHSDGGYIGYLGRTDPEVFFPSRSEACAQFILREVASIDGRNQHHDHTT
jgi:hypothetical protein